LQHAPIEAADWKALVDELFSRQVGLQPEQTGLSRKENYLLLLDRLRHTRVGSLLSRMVPVRLQRGLKRRLSRRPLHEIKS